MRLMIGVSFDAIEDVLHPVPDLSRPPEPKTAAVDWWGWRELRGGGLRSFLRWLGALGEVSYAEGVFAQHLAMEARGECHIWLGERFCYCADPEPDPVPRLMDYRRLRRPASTRAT